jgi:hypothetical protein
VRSRARARDTLLSSPLLTLSSPLLSSPLLSSPLLSSPLLCSPFRRRERKRSGGQAGRVKHIWRVCFRYVCRLSRFAGILETRKRNSINDDEPRGEGEGITSIIAAIRIRARPGGIVSLVGNGTRSDYDSRKKHGHVSVQLYPRQVDSAEEERQSEGKRREKGRRGERSEHVSTGD